MDILLYHKMERVESEIVRMRGDLTQQFLQISTVKAQPCMSRPLCPIQN